MPQISPTSVGVKVFLTYRIFFCAGTCHIFLHACYTALCFIAEADDFLILVLPFAVPFILRILFIAFMELLCLRDVGSSRIKGRQDTLFSHCFSLDLHWSKHWTLNNTHLWSFHDLMMQGTPRPREEQIRGNFPACKVKTVVQNLCIFFAKLITYVKNHGCHNSQEFLFKHIIKLIWYQWIQINQINLIFYFKSIQCNEYLWNVIPCIFLL